MNRIIQKKNEQEIAGYREEQAQKKIVNNFWQEYIRRTSDEVIINFKSTFFTNETFSHCIDRSKQNCDPK
jgi:hypothetical protein